MKSEKTGGVYVSFFSARTGKCRSVKPNVPVAHWQRRLRLFYRWRTYRRSEYMRPSAWFSKMQAFSRKGVGLSDTLNLGLRVEVPGLF